MWGEGSILPLVWHVNSIICGMTDPIVNGKQVNYGTIFLFDKTTPLNKICFYSYISVSLLFSHITYKSWPHECYFVRNLPAGWWMVIVLLRLLLDMWPDYLLLPDNIKCLEWLGTVQNSKTGHWFSLGEKDKPSYTHEVKLIS
jgi:hypothetical protein